MKVARSHAGCAVASPRGDPCPVLGAQDAAWPAAPSGRPKEAVEGTDVEGSLLLFSFL